MKVTEINENNEVFFRFDFENDDEQYQYETLLLSYGRKKSLQDYNIYLKNISSYLENTIEFKIPTRQELLSLGFSAIIQNAVKEIEEDPIKFKNLFNESLDQMRLFD